MDRMKKYTDADLKRAFEAGRDLDAEFSLPAYWRFRDYQEYRIFLKGGRKKVKEFYKTGA